MTKITCMASPTEIPFGQKYVPVEYGGKYGLHHHTHPNGTSPMSKLISIAPLVCFIIATMAGSTQAQQVGDARQGLTLAREVCAPCHLVVKEAGRSTNPDAPTFGAIAKTSGLTSAALTVMLQTSHNNMPNIVLKGDDLKNIVAYILSLKESN